MNAGEMLDFVLENKDSKDEELVKLVEGFIASKKPYNHEEKTTTAACSICDLDSLEGRLKNSDELQKFSEEVERMENALSKREACFLLSHLFVENIMMREKINTLLRGLGQRKS